LCETSFQNSLFLFKRIERFARFQTVKPVLFVSLATGLDIAGHSFTGSTIFKMILAISSAFDIAITFIHSPVASLPIINLVLWSALS
jgi:hypothetical protein